MFDFAKLQQRKRPNKSGQFQIPFDDLLTLVIAEIQSLTRTTLDNGKRYEVSVHLTHALKEIKGIAKDHDYNLKELNSLLSNLTERDLTKLNVALNAKLVENHILPAPTPQAAPSPYPNPYNYQPHIQAPQVNYLPQSVQFTFHGTFHGTLIPYPGQPNEFVFQTEQPLMKPANPKPFILPVAPVVQKQQTAPQPIRAVSKGIVQKSPKQIVTDALQRYEEKHGKIFSLVQDGTRFRYRTKIKIEKQIGDLLSEGNSFVPQDKKDYLFNLTKDQYTNSVNEAESKIDLEIQIRQVQKKAQPTLKHADKHLSRKGTPGPVKPSQERAEERKAQFANKPLRRTYSDRERLLKHVDAENQRREAGAEGFSLPPQ